MHDETPKSHSAPRNGRRSFGLLTEVPRVIERHALLRLLRTSKGLRTDVVPAAGNTRLKAPLASAANVVTVALISDTHNRHDELTALLPAKGVAQVLIHAGDFTNDGSITEVAAFAKWIGSDEVRGRFDATVVIAGNHDVRLDPAAIEGDGAAATAEASRDAEGLLRSACDVYLKHEAAPRLVCGLRIFGSPFQPASAAGFAFPFARADGHEQWRGLFEGHLSSGAHVAEGPVDVLVTHGPPLGHGDMVKGLGPMGCADLLDAVESAVTPPALHVFGHIHGGRGATTNGRTIFVNAASVGPGRADCDDGDGDGDDDDVRTPPRPLLPPFLVDLSPASPRP
jgi:Icc-related predicted phosphoesterase